MTVKPTRRKMALGRGLDALIPGPESSPDPGSAGLGAGDGYQQCPIDLIRPNRYQPRVQFPEKELAELADSVRAQGIIQPLLVRREA